MNGDPWAADPIGMGLPGYRKRYYAQRFPELAAAAAEAQDPGQGAWACSCALHRYWSGPSRPSRSWLACVSCSH
jgi:hypothetical protein